MGMRGGMFTEMPNASSWNVTTENPYVRTQSADDEFISWDDATWILACSFIIFTMQSGICLLFFFFFFLIFLKTGIVK